MRYIVPITKTTLVLSNNIRLGVDMKRSIYFLIIVMLTLFLNPRWIASQILQTEVTGKAKLSLSGIQKSYYQGEMIYAEVTLTNLTNSPLVILYEPLMYAKPFWLHLTNESGKNVRYRGPIIDSFIKYDTLSVLPNGETVTQIEVTGNWGNDTSTLTQEFLPGTYKIFASFGRGTLNTPAQEFVVQDNPPEEKAVRYSVYHELFGSGSKKSVQIAERLIRDHPHSIYLPLIYQDYLVCLDFQHMTNKLKEKSLEFIERFPQSPAVQTGVHYYSRALLEEKGSLKKANLSKDDSDDFKNQMEAIKTRFPGNARISRYVDEEINGN